MSIAAVTPRRVATVISGKELAGDTEFTTIQAAIDYAATQSPSASQPWTIYIHPGIYDEAISGFAFVSLRGIGPKGSVVIYQNDASVVRLRNGSNLENLTIRAGTLGGIRFLIYDQASAGITAKMTDLVLEIVTPGAEAWYCFYFTGAGGTFTIEGCSYNIGGTGASYGVRNTGDPVSKIHLVNNDFTSTNPNAYHISSNQAGPWTGGGNRWAGTCAMFLNSDGTFSFDNCALLATGAWLNTGSTITLRHCAIEDTVVAEDLATVRLKDCSYRAISRSGTGNIVDESAVLKGAPWKVHRWTWQALLANAQVALRGTPVDGGTGQVLLEVTDNVGGQEAVEQPADAAGALDSSFTPARTPRFATQISVDSFDADVTMFFGLRQTLDDDVPAHPEHHAGFIWNGTNFNASSNDGVATQTTDAGTPTTGVKHQLEVVVFGGVTTVGWVEFYVDGVLVATHSTNIPVNALDWQHLLQTAGLGTGDVIQVTVESGGCQECPA